MPDTGFILPATAVTTPQAESDAAWIAPTNALLSDNLRTVVPLNFGAGTIESDWLLLTFDLFKHLPEGAHIFGIECRVEHSESATGCRVHRVRLFDGTTEIGTTKTPNTDMPAADIQTTYGTATDLWGAVLSAQFLRTTFGIGVQCDTTAGASAAQIDTVECKVHYASVAPDAPTIPGAGLRLLDD